MPTIHRFEELLVWKIARELCQEIYLYTNRVEFNHDYSLNKKSDTCFRWFWNG